MYKAPESTSYTFVIRPNGELRSYLDKEVLMSLYQDDRVLVDSEWAKKDTLKKRFKSLVFKYALDSQNPQSNKYYWYIGMDSKNKLVPIPFLFPTFSLTCFKNKATCLKAIEKAENNFTSKELYTIFH